MLTAPSLGAVSTWGDLRGVLGERDYRRLLTTRVVSQAGDGAFQVGLAGLFFFSPERATTTTAVAWVLSAALLPYTLVGPFAGVLLDRWPRRQVLLVANLVRAVLVCGAAGLVALGGVGVALYVVALACLSVNRFFLAGLSASLPHVVARHRLVMANSITPTAGTVATIVGAAAAVVLRTSLGSGDTTDAIVLLTGAAAYALSSAVVALLGRQRLGPTGRTVGVPVWHQLRTVAAGMVAGARHVRERREPLRALAVIGALRLGFGLFTIAVVLLCRNALVPPDDPTPGDTGLALVAGVLVVAGLGAGLAAVITPVFVPRTGTTAWIVGWLLAGGAALSVWSTGVTLPTLYLGAGVLGLAAQAVKISVDSIVQTTVDDRYRGRVFSFYDVVFNAAAILAGLVAVLVLPDDGQSAVAYAGVAVLYAASAAAYLTRSRRAYRAVTGS